MPSPTSARTPRVMNPLWIISLFLGISELTVGAAATQSSGWVQSIFALFAVIFPAGVAGLFFAVLWKRPFVLYAPGDFPRHTPVSAFVEAMRSSSSVNVKMIESMVRSAVEAIAPALQESPQASTHELTSVIDEAVVAARREFEENSIYVSLRAVDPDRFGGVAIPIIEQSTVSDLLNEIWFHISDYVPPYTYGDRWELVYRDSAGIDRSLRSSPAPGRPDKRLLGDVGLHTRDRVAAVLINMPK